MKRNYNIINFILGIIIIILLNVISSQFFFRLDLTEEKRYTIAPQTKYALQQLDDIIYVEIYLDGDLPPGFKRLQKAVKENLEEFRIYAGSNIQYKFIDPVADKDERSRQRYMMQLAERGVQPTNLYANEDGKQTEKLIFPGAIVTYKGREAPIVFLKGSTGASPAEALNQSVEGVEFELISAIKKVAIKNKKRIGILDGHGELSNIQLDDLYRSLRENYLVERVDPKMIENFSDYFDLLIVPKPTQYFSEDDKLKIDQFIIKGGRAIFLLSKLKIDIDSLADGRGLALPYELNLDDLLFRYGVRVNNSLIQDLQCGALPMVIGNMGDKPQTQLVPWTYYPVLTQFGKHPIVKNMSATMCKFVSSIDTVKAVGIKKTPLMFTSNYNKEVEGNIQVDLNSAKKQPDPATFTQAPKVTGYLLEGPFKSLYVNRLTDEKQKAITFKSTFAESKIIVISDGNLAKNDVSPDQKQTYPLGFDRFMRKRFANKELIMNAVDFLCDENGVINVRSKEIKLRPLDKKKIKKERTKWQMINVVLPVVLVIIFGLIKMYRRKKKYAH